MTWSPGFRSVRAALEFYYAFRATGGMRALDLDPETDPGGWNPDGCHDRPLLMGKIGRSLDRLPRTAQKILVRAHGPGRVFCDAAQARALERAELRLSRLLLESGVLHPELLLDGWAEFTTYVGAPEPALRKTLAAHPLQRLAGRRFQTLRPWVDKWLETLPQESRRRLGVSVARGHFD
jgi:hypothetical protein